MPLTDHPLVPTGLLPAPRWLIKDIIPLGNSPSESFITVLFGPGGTFKTYVLMAWGLCIATGRPWFGHKVRQGNMLYIAADDPGGPQPRAQAWADYFALSQPDLDRLATTARLIKMPINFFKDKEVDQAIDYVVKTMAFQPMAIFIDTYFHSSQGADISTSPKDNLEIIGNIRRFAKQVGAEAMIVSDHTPKDSRSLFGSVIKGVSIDVLWESQKDDDSETSGTLTNTRMRNAPISPPLALEFEKVDHRTQPDDDGRTIFPQLVLANVCETPTPDARTISQKEREQRFDDILATACNVIGENWRVGQTIPSRRDFHKLTEAKLNTGFGPATFGHVLDDLIDRKILRRIGSGTGAKYQVVLAPGGTKRKSGNGNAAVVFPVDFVSTVSGSKDPETQKQETAFLDPLLETPETKATAGGKKEKPVEPSEKGEPLNFDDVLGEAVASVLAKPRASRR